MTILVDAGNSRVKWAQCVGEEMHIGEPFATDSGALAAELQARWSALPPQPVYLSNVAGLDWERRFVDWVRQVWRAEVHVARTSRDAFGILNAYEQPEKLGVDRWVGLIGARARFGLPVCLVDCGTAITVDLVDREGRHRGGLIAPGLALMVGALRGRVPGIDGGVDSVECFWGCNTAHGLANGVREMALGLIERAIRGARITLGMEPTLVLTGGDAERLAAHLDIRHRHAPDVVLRGLAEIARRDRSTTLSG